MDREALMLMSETTMRRVFTTTTAIGPDGITVASAAAVRGAQGRTAELLAGEYQIMGERLITEAGDDFDPRSGSIRSLITTGDRLVACCLYAAVVRTGDGHTAHNVPRERELVDSVASPTTLHPTGDDPGAYRHRSRIGRDVPNDDSLTLTGGSTRRQQGAVVCGGKWLPAQ
jgi:hypothetical protein